MKRSGIFALATACAMGVTALVGGIGYASALDVAEQAGRSIDVAGVSTVDSGSGRLVGSPRLDPSAEPAAADDAAAGDETADAPPVDHGAARQGPGGAVDEVDPADPVVIGGTKKAERKADKAPSGDGRSWSKDRSKSWGDTKGSDAPREGTSDDRGGDRHGDHRSGKGGTHGHPGGGKHGGGGWGGGRR